MELKNILENIEKVEKDVLDYISNTEHCLFYWISDRCLHGHTRCRDNTICGYKDTQ
jgi:hypothetical protein